MNVALISFHNAYNFGAALQAYGLQNAVEQMGLDCEYINYVNTSRREEYDMLAQIRREAKKHNYVRVVKLLVGIPFMSGRKRNFDRYYSEYLRKTEKVYTTSEEAEALNDQYDKFVVGSDQVWNPENNGQDFAFLLDFVHDKSKRISYSSSFGIQAVPQEMAVGYAENLKDFYRLSTRESVGVEIIRCLCGREAHLVLDPVFLPDKRIWDTMADKMKTTGKDYVFFYTNRGNQIDDFLNTGYPVEHMELHILSSHVSPADFINRKRKVKFSMSPEQFLSEIKNAKLVVTASFHCLAFAIIFHKPFVAILTGDRGKDERVLNILRICGLEKRAFSEEMTPDIINAPIDYDTVDVRIEKYRTNSGIYLKNALLDKEDVDFSCNQIPVNEKIRNVKNIGVGCTGCTACVSACLNGAIQMQPNEEGFMKPIIDEEKCISCGICVKKCQALQSMEPRDFTQKYFGVKNQDVVREKSSSGGVFTSLAEAVLRESGVVCAAQMNDDFVVSHVLEDSAKAIERMRGTFYVQSNLNTCFSRVQKNLKAGRQVLFVGTPCQVRGLQLFLGKDYTKLLSVDLICHGVPSPMVFSQFIEYIRTKGKLTDFKFRDKNDGWSGYHVTAVINEKKYINALWLQSFNNLFAHNLINRPSCAFCRYSSYSRPGDLTIGDFWGIEKVDPLFADRLGVSLVLVNSQKGMSWLQKASGLEKKEYNREKTEQNSLLHPAGMNSNRKKAFAVLKQEGYEALIRQYGEYNGIGMLKKIIRKLFVRFL